MSKEDEKHASFFVKQQRHTPFITFVIFGENVGKQ